MKLIEIDKDNLCKDYVLAYSVSEKKLIGKLANMNGDVVCVSHETSLSNISHYLPLNDIKPESEKPSLLDALPDDWIIQKYSNRLTIYSTDRDFEDGIHYDKQLMIESISDFEQRMIETFQIG